MAWSLVRLAMSSRSTLQCLDATRPSLQLESLKLQREVGHASGTQRHASDTHDLSNLKGSAQLQLHQLQP